MSSPIEIDTIESSKSLKHRRDEEKISESNKKPSFGQLWALNLKEAREQQEKKEAELFTVKLDAIEPILHLIYSRADIGHVWCHVNQNLIEKIENLECMRINEVKSFLEETLGFMTREIHDGNLTILWEHIENTKSFKTEQVAAPRNKVIDMMKSCNQISWCDVVKNFVMCASAFSESAKPATLKTIRLEEDEIPNVLKCTVKKVLSFDLGSWKISNDFIKALEEENILVKLEDSSNTLVFSPSVAS